MPKVTVLMTTYNEEKNIIKQAIESIINQTFQDWEMLIIIDNPNNNDAIDTIEKMSHESGCKIKYEINEKNLGLPLSLNRGIEQIKTEYIARMDADDIADKERLEKQYNYAKNNPQVDLFGSNICYMNYNGKVLYKRKPIPTKYKNIKKTAKYLNVFNHPTLFGKTKVFKEMKYRNLKYSQDYDFTCRAMENGFILENMPDYLLKYRLIDNKSDEKIVRQKITCYCIQKEYSNGNLTNIDIQKEVEEELKIVDKDKLLQTMKLYDTAFDKLRKKNIVMFVVYIVRSFFKSKYQRKQILNLCKYLTAKSKK